MKNAKRYCRLILIGMVALAAARTARADDKEPTSPSTIASGSLSKYGITAGVALAMFTPIYGGSTQRSFSAGPMPYIEVRPGLLGRSDITRAYCIARHTVLNPQQTADALALKKSGLSITDVEKKSIDRLTEDDLTLLFGADRAGQEHFEPSQPEKTTAEILSFVKKTTGWDLGMPGDCGWRWPSIVPTDVGIYVGRPTTYKGNAPYTTIDSDAGTQTVTHKQVDIDPMISFGVTYSPISEVRLMVGVMRSNAVLKTDGPYKHVWAWTFAIGGNLDIAGALIPK